ncbi:MULTISPECIES: response regulator [Nostocales]|uniref:Chemotaxis protein CheY n=3 Tax=Nostocales TaxID=1161 RepID=A0A0C1RJU4_9CYAN|nr:response regulator [Tolypothrix bouteillei]KAF3890393.1 response regulator [Tolypothrix bouteillei VB521301]
MPRRILLIDDEERLREVIQTCLEVMGDWEVLTAGTANEGLVKAETEQPYAILLDVMMPEMDGITLFRHLQQNPATQSIPVILLTAKMQPVDREQFAQLGIAGVIAKPFDALTLADRVTELLSST